MKFPRFRRKKKNSSSLVTQLHSLEPNAGIFSNTAAPIDNGAVHSKGPLGLTLLYSPSEPLIDFVFVHGLGGGSRSTWSKAPSAYWPKEWLPKDTAFKNVRVHSFGYDSDFIGSKDNCLNIHHFSKALLCDLRTSPYLEDANTPIVLLGHSMGGLVIKKAYILASQETVYGDLVNRFHSIYFLATPHRGAGSAKFLNDFLKIAYLSRAYVADLERESIVIKAINDEFKKYSKDIVLWSFYETQRLSIGFFRKLIVDPDLAVLGYPEENRVPMNADHRSICKFETPEDLPYIILRDALASTVRNISTIVLKLENKLWRSQIKDLEKYLGTSTEIEDDFYFVDDSRMPRICQWLSSNPTYMRWRDFSPESPSILWVNGRPTTGNSVLASYVIGELRKANANCSYFFFKNGDRSNTRLSSCLRSLALQMACAYIKFREALLETHNDGTMADNEDELHVWQRLFLSSNFQTTFTNHYWIIDGLDECVDLVSLFNPILEKLDGPIPLRILITSRRTSALEKHFFNLGSHRFRSLNLSSADTLSDKSLN